MISFPAFFLGLTMLVIHCQRHWSSRWVMGINVDKKIYHNKCKLNHRLRKTLGNVFQQTTFQGLRLFDECFSMSGLCGVDIGHCCMVIH